MLTVFKKNKFGNNCYVEDENGTVPFESLSDTVVWTIENPSDRLIQSMTSTNQLICEYNGTKFLTTKFAQEKFPSGSGNGSACIIRYTDYDNKVWFILVSDNKPYLQNCCGSANRVNENSSEAQEELPEENILRELKEELKIFVPKDKLILLGGWSFLNVNELINLNRECVTTLFMINVTSDDIAHILPFACLSTSHLCTIATTDLQCELDETEYIYFVSQENIDNIPDKINGKNFNGHHRGILRMVSGLQGDYSYPYLSTFNIDVSVI